jgi:CTP synthase
MTSGMVYKTVIDRERNLGYHGKFVEAIPHVRDEIVDRLKLSAKMSKSDVTVVEIGGTVGDFQNALYIDAARLLHLNSPGDVIFVMVSYLPIPSTIGEMKTRPTQHAVHALNSYGIQPNFIIAVHLGHLIKREKKSLLCGVVYQ